MEGTEKVAGSFRDPSGFLFTSGGNIFRQVNKSYKEDYDLLKSSGLYDKLTETELLIPHEEVEEEPPCPGSAYKIIRPEPVPFISYPYEWCFSQLKHAALTTLKIQKISLEYGMSLKDSSAYNIQFRGCKPVFIDTLSFEKYREGAPWNAYGQFCRHFLAPLALMAYKDACLNRLFRVFIDGVPLDLASSLLPGSTLLKLPILSHIHIHSKSRERFADRTVNPPRAGMSRLAFSGLIDSLESAVKKLRWKTGNTCWAGYYEDTNYSDEAMDRKRELVSKFLDRIGPETVWDLGANTGAFSRIACGKGIRTISFDIDSSAVEQNYLSGIEKGEKGLLPLLLDLENPSPGIGWANRERMSLRERGPADCALALALVHHLAISNNLPFAEIADYFREICVNLIIEFIPKSDSKAKKLLSSREDIFDCYSRKDFEKEFGIYFKIIHSEEIRDSERHIYLMRRI